MSEITNGQTDEAVDIDLLLTVMDIVMHVINCYDCQEQNDITDSTTEHLCEKTEKSIPCPEMGCQLIKLIDLFDPHGMKNLYGKV